MLIEILMIILRWLGWVTEGNSSVPLELQPNNDRAGQSANPAGKLDAPQSPASQQEYAAINLYTPGIEAETFEIDGYRFSCALCIEAQFPEVFSEYENVNADAVHFFNQWRPGQFQQPRSPESYEFLTQKPPGNSPSGSSFTPQIIMYG